jgi:hypothetical protein
MKQLNKVLVFVLMLVFLTGCYWNEDVATNQKAVKLDKNKIQEVVGPGVYSEMGCYFCDLKTVNTDTLTFSVDDPEVLTKDNQAVSVKITIQARRKGDDESVKNLFTNWSSLIDDTNFINTISATAREGMKVGTRNYTLTQLLDERSGTTGADGSVAGLAEDIREAIQEDANEYGGEIVNVTVENIGASPEYMEVLAQTANLNAEIDKAKREQELIKQNALNAVLQQEQRITVAEKQVLAEQAETDVQVEIASRAGEVIAAQNEVYTLNREAYELERLRLMEKIFGNKTMFLPSDIVLNLIQGSSSILPIPQAAP